MSLDGPSESGRQEGPRKSRSRSRCLKGKVDQWTRNLDVQALGVLVVGGIKFTRCVE